MESKSAYQRILLKLSGEVITGFQKTENQGMICLNEIVSSIQQVHASGVQIGIVIGGGNILRGISAHSYGLNRQTADQIGMLATVINALALQQALEKGKCPCKILSAVECGSIVERYSWKRAIDLLEKGNVVIYSGGTGNPYFSTDTAAVLRALETCAEIVLKATKVDGIYDKDPLRFKDAKMEKEISYREVLEKKLSVMDLTAVLLCQQHKLPIHVFNLFTNDALKKVLSKEKIGTLVLGE
jgi:uridylate kinase